MAIKKKAKKAVKKRVAKKATKKKTVKKKAVKRKVTKKTAKKKIAKKKESNKKKVTVSKSVKKQLASNKKSTTKANKKNISQDKEIAKLKEEVAKLQVKGKKTKKKVNSKRISEYNLFIRKQITAGYTFVQAVKEWNKYQNLMSKNKRRPSAYNQFIGSQMRLGKTFTQSVALWKLAKAGKLGRKGSTRTVEKIKYKTRTVQSKPEIKYRTRTKTVEAKPKIQYRTKTNTVIKRIKSKPKVITKVVYRTKKVPVEKSTTKVVKQSVDYNKIRDMFSSLSSMKSVTKSEMKEVVEWDEEEIAFKIVQTYFKEIARFGFKKRLTLDEIVNAYLYSLARVRRQEHNELDVAEAVKRSGMRK